MTEAIQRLVASKGFQRAVLGAILVAAVLVGLETSPEVMRRFGRVILALDWAIIILFAVEALLKMAQHGRRWYVYFGDPWNVFDFTIVAVCVLPVGGHYAAVLRLARVLRALRLVSAAPKLQLLVGSLLRSLPAMMWVGVLLFLLFYVYAVMGVFLFRPNDPVHFRDLPTSMLTLFRVVTLEDWTDVMYTQMLGSASDPTYINTSGLPIDSRPQPLVGAFYFVSFVVLGTMIMLNLFIGVIISSMNEAQAESERRLRQKHVDATGRPTLGDELTELEHELEALARRVKELRREA